MDELICTGILSICSSERVRCERLVSSSVEKEV